MYEKIADKEPYRHDEKEFKELNDLLATQYGAIDGMFQDRELLNLF